MGKAKKDADEITVREYIESHRSEINESVRAALSQLDGSSAPAVSLLTDVPVDQLQDFGGCPR
jgi:hypothetical protein